MIRYAATPMVTLWRNQVPHELAAEQWLTGNIFLGWQIATGNSHGVKPDECWNDIKRGNPWRSGDAL